MNENGQLLIANDGVVRIVCGWVEQIGWRIDDSETWIQDAELDEVIEEWGQETVTMDPGLAGTMTLPAKDGKSARTYKCDSTGAIYPELEQYHSA